MVCFALQLVSSPWRAYAPDIPLLSVGVLFVPCFAYPVKCVAYFIRVIRILFRASAFPARPSATPRWDAQHRMNQVWARGATLLKKFVSNVILYEKA